MAAPTRFHPRPQGRRSPCFLCPLQHFILGDLLEDGSSEGVSGTWLQFDWHFSKSGPEHLVMCFMDIWMPSLEKCLFRFLPVFLLGWFFSCSWAVGASLVAQLVKNPPAMQETWVGSLGWEDPLEKGNAAHSSIPAWRIPWAVQSMGHRESDTTEWVSLSLCEHSASLEMNSLFLTSAANVYFPILRVVFFYPSGLPFLCKSFSG